MMTRPATESAGLGLLDGVKIVAFTTFLIGPAATQYLADIGADVIKVEEPSRGPHERHWAGAGTFLNDTSAFFLMSNRNARSVALDLKSDEGRQIALDLCSEADVVVSNFRPDVMERLGLDFPTLRERNERLIYARASGYGADGPFVRLPGQDLLLQATTGLVAATGSPGRPVAVGAAIVDQHASSLLAMGILAALYHRTQTGQGQLVDTTMIQAALDLQSEGYALQLNGADLKPSDTGLATTYHEAPYGIYEVADGHIALSMSPVAVLSDALGAPAELEQWLDPAISFTERDAIYKAVAPLLRDAERRPLIGLLRDHGVWCAPVNSYEEALDDPIVQGVEPVVEFDHPDAGRVRVIGHPITYSSGEFEISQVPPALGQHTREVLTDLGIVVDEIDRLAKEGRIRV